MTTEEPDALDALRECATPAPWLHSMWRSHEDCDTLQWCAIGPAHDVVGNEEEDDDSTAYGAAAVDADYLTALVNAAPRLLAEAREAATLRAKLAEVTGQRDAALKGPTFSRSELDTDVCDDCGDFLSGTDEELAARARACGRCAARALEAAP